MRKFFVLITLLFAVSISAYGQNPKSDTIVIKTNIYCDHCMECGSCAGRINLSLQKYPGIKTVKISPEENTITINYNPRKTNPGKLRDIINEAGFDADDKKAPATSVATLDECCKLK